MNLKASRDPHFYCYFCVDQEGLLANLFWRDSKCLVDYNNFGDILIMDSTCKTNIYGKPLVVFVGVNNHRATVPFGCALLVDETEETYKWVLSTFIDSMGGNKPISVITDQDDAMRNAVVELIPDARYRLCGWHISKNVIGKIHHVNVQRDFMHLIYSGLSVTEWESYWNYVVAMAGLHDNPWVIGMYNKRERWAEAFFKEDFFAGVRSTQRCEQMHRNMKTGLGKYMRLYEVLPRLDKTMNRIRERVLFDDFVSVNASPVIGDHMSLLQEQLEKKFTHDIFLLLQDQIRFESRFIVDDEFHFPDLGSSVVTLTQYGKTA
ncbi:protein FAR1-RELATED SEQUENCE 5-like [Rosa rugosa]|uniref:protein FAR1-RELATED SEQUENCE 5-like n=1 Tax=Rosa rugosa TaxID=74645 RepID=UPI002B410C9F|nr:protein FAR1-RELATED SEQUENCE 5-like [Rosa rugosa]XP_062016391.1 protein FAR1-RELATED SEQUENCE 5-like [Rosa rugosa]XP_062016392.1 protein FAR1-RELATED SEQUENCE 5-like [Rosa rugosa]